MLKFTPLFSPENTEFIVLYLQPLGMTTLTH